MNENDMRITGYLLVETGDGRRLVESRIDQLIPAVFGPYRLEEAERVIADMLRLSITGPVRSRIRAFLDQLQAEHHPYVRLDRPRPELGWDEEPQEEVEFHRLFKWSAHEAQLEESL